MRLAPEEESKKLTGFVHNAVTCIGMDTDIPVNFYYFGPPHHFLSHLLILTIVVIPIVYFHGEIQSAQPVDFPFLLHPLQVILDEAIVKLDPDFFWLGGGEVDLKLGIRTPQFISAIRPFVVSCSM